MYCGQLWVNFIGRGGWLGFWFSSFFNHYRVLFHPPISAFSSTQRNLNSISTLRWSCCNAVQPGLPRPARALWDPVQGCVVLQLCMTEVFSVLFALETRFQCILLTVSNLSSSVQFFKTFITQQFQTWLGSYNSDLKWNFDPSFDKFIKKSSFLPA